MNFAYVSNLCSSLEAVHDMVDELMSTFDAQYPNVEVMDIEHSVVVREGEGVLVSLLYKWRYPAVAGPK